MIRLTRRYKFSASHRLDAPPLSAEANRALYGKCNNPFGHGHNYELEVRVRGPIDARTGLVVDLSKLDDLVGRLVIARFDHRYLNDEVPEFSRAVPTSENLAVEIGRRLGESWSETFPQGSPALDRVRLRETDRNIFDLPQDTVQ